MVSSGLTTKLRNVAQALTCCFAAGAFGGLVNFILPILLGMMGVPQSVGVRIAPWFEKAVLYHKITWGGIWGIVFLIPLRNAHMNWYLQALLYGMGPTLVQLLVVFPVTTKFGIGGLGLGALTPLFVILYNSVGWSLPGLWWFDLLHGQDEGAGLPGHGEAVTVWVWPWWSGSSTKE